MGRLKYNITLSAILAILASALLYSLLTTPPARADFGFDELQQLDRAEQDDLLEQAKKAARNWSFGTAENYLKQAAPLRQQTELQQHIH